MQTFSELTLALLRQPITTAQYRYLLIDTSVTAGINIAQQLRLENSALDVLTGVGVEWKKSVSPVLLPLPNAPLSTTQLSAWEKFSERWKWANALMLLQSSLPIQNLSQQLKARTEVQLPDDMTVLLRFFDTRVFATLLEVLTSEQRSVFCEIANWIYPDRSGDAHELNTQNDSAQALQLNPAFQLNAGQEAAMVESSDTDAMRNLLLQQGHAALAKLTPPQQYEAVSKLLTCCGIYGVDQLSDQVAFCHVGLDLGPDFPLQAPWAQELEKLSTKAITFTKLLQQI
jgi:hypothetical protein